MRNLLLLLLLLRCKVLHNSTSSEVCAPGNAFVAPACFASIF
jgi:hypothetical protein